MTCPSDCPIPGALELGVPEGNCTNKVLVLAEALGDAERADGGRPLRPWAPAGSVFQRALNRAGYQRDEFVLFNTVPTHPPRNYLEGAVYERAAINWGASYVDRVVADYKPRCVLALGNVPLKAMTGMTGVASLRGWVLPSRFPHIPVISTFHPSFLRREAMELFGVLMHDIKLAVAVASGQRARFFSPVLWRDYEYVPFAPGDPYHPAMPSGYNIRPSEGDAHEFMVAAESAALVAYDIETPRSKGASEVDSDELADTDIISVQFSIGRGTGIFMPWRLPYIEYARRILANPAAKAGANTWRFDDPLLEAHGCRLNGVRHDVRWMWKTLQPDIKAGLQFITSFYGLEMGPWKHLHESHPGYYGIADVDAIQRIMC